MHQTTYWVYDEEHDRFGPSKFVGYEDMDFELYDAALRGAITGARFDGNVAHHAIEHLTKQAFSADTKLAGKLMNWAERMFGPDVFAGVEGSKWQFLRLSSGRSFWAFASNPAVYRIDDAVTDLAEDLWTVKRGEVKQGDRFLVWQTAGGLHHRGVIALGEVLSDPEMLGLPPELHPYCIDHNVLQPERRVRIRYLIPTGVPLWLDDDTTGTLEKLSVARATGGSVFHVTPSEWNAVANLVGGWPDKTMASQPLPLSTKSGLTRQGINLDPRVRTAVERYAVQKAREHYRALGYVVEERGKPYDLRCTKAGEVLHVEVKGTQTTGEDVLLTPNEVSFAENHRDSMALFVVSLCSVDTTKGEVVVSAGTPRVLKPWNLDRAALTATGYSYCLPGTKIVASSEAATVSR